VEVAEGIFMECFLVFVSLNTIINIPRQSYTFTIAQDDIDKIISLTAGALDPCAQIDSKSTGYLYISIQNMSNFFYKPDGKLR